MDELSVYSCLIYLTGVEYRGVYPPKSFEQVSHLTELEVRRYRRWEQGDEGWGCELPPNYCNIPFP